MPSAVSSLLYLAMNTRSDILFVVNKLAKSATNPGIQDFKALIHCFGYLRKYPDYGIKFYSNLNDSPSYQIYKTLKLKNDSELIGFTDASWQDCVDTGRSTSGFKIFLQGGLIDANSTLNVPVALSSAESEYMGACNCAAMLCHLRELVYDINNLGLSTYDIDDIKGNPPSVLLVDNQATVKMGESYKVTSKTLHIARRWHFVRSGQEQNLFKLHWIAGESQLADDMTKLQASSTSLKHFKSTHVKIPEKVKGFKSSTVGNR